jgi:manganese transport protein
VSGSCTCTFANPLWLKVMAWTVALLIAGLNVWLLVQTFQNWLS